MLVKEGERTKSYIWLCISYNFITNLKCSCLLWHILLQYFSFSFPFSYNWIQSESVLIKNFQAMDISQSLWIQLNDITTGCDFRLCTWEMVAAPVVVNGTVTSLWTGEEVKLCEWEEGCFCAGEVRYEGSGPLVFTFSNLPNNLIYLLILTELQLMLENNLFPCCIQVWWGCPITRSCSITGV